MNPHARMLAMALLASASAAAVIAPSDVLAQSMQTPQEYGRVSFKTSCTPQAQEKFDRGVALVHSFVYPESVRRQLEPAFRHYRLALTLNPRHRSAHEHLCEAHLVVGNLREAEEHLASLERICLIPCEEYYELKRTITEHGQSVVR